MATQVIDLNKTLFEK